MNAYARASPPVREDHLDHVTILDAGDDPKRPATGRAALDVAAVDASQALCLYALWVQPIALRRLGRSGSVGFARTWPLRSRPFPPGPRPAGVTRTRRA